MKAGQEIEHLKYLLSQEASEVEKKPFSFKASIREQAIKENSHLDQQDKKQIMLFHKLQSIKLKDVPKADTKRLAEVYQKYKKLMPMPKSLKQLQEEFSSQAGQREYETSRQKVVRIKKNARQKEHKIQKAQVMKEQLIQDKISAIKQQLYSRSQDHRKLVQQQQTKAQMQQKTRCAMLSYLALEQVLRFVIECAAKSLVMQRTRFKLNRSCKIIQKAWRSHKIRAKYIDKMEPWIKQRYQKCILKFKIRRRIRIRRQGVKVVLENLLLQQFRQKTAAALIQLTRKIRM